MTAVLLALLSALAYGIYDFIGGAAARRASAWSVSFVVLCANALTFLVAAPWFPSLATGTDVLWGMAGGVGSGAGVSFLFRGLATGRMGVVAPMAAVGGAVLPAVAGFALGERLSIALLVGLMAGIPAIWLISAGGAHRDDPLDPVARPRPLRLFDRGVLDGFLAGAAFALAYVALDQIAPDAGLWPLFTMQAVSAVCVPLLAMTLGARVFPLSRAALRAWYAGPIGAVACVAFFFATSHGMLTVAAVLASLNPAVTIVLAFVLLHERITHTQGMGLALAAVCVALVVIG